MFDESLRARLIRPCSCSTRTIQPENINRLVPTHQDVIYTHLVLNVRRDEFWTFSDYDVRVEKKIGERVIGCAASGKSIGFEQEKNFARGTDVWCTSLLVERKSVQIHSAIPKNHCSQLC
ncbi:uncharacterized protein LOC143186296 [Calliopsis andreniformis]|uniref:uncharacterized protein LOC143186296 n=1 Tax=Calliopsis andreniformis TaxID=337506 RepID=UPI003FCC7271